MAWGDFPESDKEPESLFMPRGVIMKRDLKGVKMADQDKVTEHVAHAWYKGKDALHPYKGETEPAARRIRHRRQIHLVQGAPL